jgi:hypothetical protein
MHEKSVGLSKDTFLVTFMMHIKVTAPTYQCIKQVINQVMHKIKLILEIYKIMSIS